MKNSIKKYIYLFIATTIFSPVSFLYAQGTPATGGGPTTPSAGLNNPITRATFTEIVNAILNVVVTVGAVIVVLAIIYAGFLFVTARGNVEQIEKAKKTFLWVVIGAIVLLGAQTLSLILTNTAGQLGVGIR